MSKQAAVEHAVAAAKELLTEAREGLAEAKQELSDADTPGERNDCMAGIAYYEGQVKLHERRIRMVRRAGIGDTDETTV